MPPPVSFLKLVFLHVDSLPSFVMPANSRVHVGYSENTEVQGRMDEQTLGSTCILTLFDRDFSLAS
jgi:hypothetical protein